MDHAPNAGHDRPQSLHRPLRSLAMLSRSFHHRNFRLFFAGQFVSLIGTWMQSVAVSWLVYRLTGSSLYLGLVGFAGQIPVFILGLWGGYVADSGNKRGILVATQTAAMLQALALAALTFSDRANVWAVAGLAAVLGVVNAVDMPTRQAFVVEMVGREDLNNAIALNSSMFNAARILGPSLAGILVAAIGEGWCFLGNGLSYLAVIAGLLLMRLPPYQTRPGKNRFLTHVAEGLAYAWRDHPMRAILGSLAITNLFGSSFLVLMPIFADKILGQGARGLGILMAATGVGSVAAALTLALRQGTKGLGRWRVLSGLGFGVSLILFAFSRSFWLSVLLQPLVGYCLILFLAASNTLLQLRSPDALRGRVMSLYSITIVGMAPFGALFAGSLAHAVGAPLTVVVAGAICLIGTAFLARSGEDPGPQPPVR